MDNTPEKMPKQAQKEFANKEDKVTCELRESLYKNLKNTKDHPLKGYSLMKEPMDIEKPN